MKTHKWKFEFKDGTIAIEEYPVESAEEAVNIKCGTNTVGLSKCTLVPEDEVVEGAVDAQPAANDGAGLKTNEAPIAVNVCVKCGTPLQDIENNGCDVAECPYKPAEDEHG